MLSHLEFSIIKAFEQNSDIKTEFLVRSAPRGSLDLEQKIESKKICKKWENLFTIHSEQSIINLEYTGTERVDYLYDENGMLYGFIHNNAKYFYIRDTLKNILGIIDANGTCVVHYNYSAYGSIGRICAYYNG